MGDREVETLGDVKAWVAEIAACANDDEHAHIQEDELWGAVLRAVVRGNAEAQAMAAAALETAGLNFERWCA